MEQTGKGSDLDPLVELARQSIQTFVRHSRTIAAPEPIPSAMKYRAGAFVSIKKQGHLRGCIGTFLPTQQTLAQEVIVNAIKSATSDPRFPPLHESELANLTLSVDVLSEPEPCNRHQLDPSRYGVIVESGWRRGLLLPDLDGIDTVEEQLAIARGKAGIGPDDPISLFRFTVDRHT
jgi:AmmeMemoRadiSam system protein A